VTDEELNGHIEIVEQCRDYLDHEAMDNGDPSGKLRDFVESLRAMLARVQRLEALEVAAREWRAGMVEVAPGRHIDSDDGNSEPHMTREPARDALVRAIDALTTEQKP
jgi:hypothetical protein